MGLKQSEIIMVYVETENKQIHFSYMDETTQQSPL